jgi:hypothetical protein
LRIGFGVAVGLVFVVAALYAVWVRNKTFLVADVVVAIVLSGAIKARSKYFGSLD